MIDLILFYLEVHLAHSRLAYIYFRSVHIQFIYFDFERFASQNSICKPHSIKCKRWQINMIQAVYEQIAVVFVSIEIWNMIVFFSLKFNNKNLIFFGIYVSNLFFFISAFSNQFFREGVDVWIQHISKHTLNGILLLEN